MVIPGPLRGLYEDTGPDIVVMKGAQLGLSEWIINACLWVPDTAYAVRGTSFYVQPTGGAAGDFVQGRVRPAIDQSPYLTGRMGKIGRTSDPDKVGLMRLGAGYAYWRTARSRAGLISVPADLIALDEFDTMPEGVLDLVSHRLDSSLRRMTLIISTPTYPGVGIDPKYREGDQRVFMLRCEECDTEQALEWSKNVEEREGPDGPYLERVCVRCRESIEPLIEASWKSGRDPETGERTEVIGRWVEQNPGAEVHSYHLSQLYRPTADLKTIAERLASGNAYTQQEAQNQHLGLPWSPPGGQLSLEELQRAATAPFTLSDIAGVQGCYMGIDVGAKLHVWIEWASDRYGPEVQRYLVAALELDTFAEVAEAWRRFGVQMCVIDANPELRAARDFAADFPGRVFLADYKLGQMPPAIAGDEPEDAKKRFRVQVDRTAAMDSLAAMVRGGGVLLPSDAASVPGLFAHLQAPVRILKPDPQGNPRAVFDEGSRPDHYYHAGVYCDLAIYIAKRVVQVQQGYDPRAWSDLGAWDRPGEVY